ncbi:MAG: RNA-binding cell elongation regulator Jag/EloR [Phototrophicaceae bacterium]
MSDSNSVVITAPTIDDAVQEGLAKLKAKSWEVIVEVLEEPSRGFNGVGERDAVVRLQRIAPSNYSGGVSSISSYQETVSIFAEGYRTPDRVGNNQTQSISSWKPEDETPKKDTPPRERNNNNKRRGAGAQDGAKRSKPAGDEKRPERGGRRERPNNNNPRSNKPEVAEEPVPEYIARTFEHDGTLEQYSVSVLSTLLDILGYDPQVEVHQSDRKADDEEVAATVLDIEAGEKSNGLIGRRGEVLNALQYITRLIVSKEFGEHTNLMVDVEGYRSRRSVTLERLATRMADQAVTTSRVVTMEPMPANERRIIHMTLREREDVSTESAGEGDERRVTIIPKGLSQ